VIEKWAPEHRLVKVVAEKPGRIALHLLNYPAWRVLLNGNSVPATHPDGTQQMIIAIPRGESEVQIDFTRTFDRTLGGVISIFSLLVWLIAWFWSRPAQRIARS
jgi:outer membrane lipoprotein-sorting protein